MDGNVALGDIVHQQLPVLLTEFGQHRSADSASYVAAHRGLQLSDADPAASNGRDEIQCLVRMLAGKRVARA